MGAIKRRKYLSDSIGGFDVYEDKVLGTRNLTFLGTVLSSFEMFLYRYCVAEEEDDSNGPPGQKDARNVGI